MLNRCDFIGHLGADPESRSFQNGGKVVNFRLAVTEKWKDRNGDRKERTEWVSVAVFSEGLCGVAEKYLRKGSRAFVSGKMQTRKWQDQSGNDRYSTEVVLQGFDAKLVLLDRAEGSDSGSERRTYERGQEGHIPGFDDGLDDSVPF